MINITAEVSAQFVAVIGALVFAVMLITEVIKNLSFMKNVPTDIVVLALSMILTVAAFAAYTQYTAMVITWYMVVAAIICGFFVAFVAMFGWGKFRELWCRYSTLDDKE